MSDSKHSARSADIPDRLMPAENLPVLVCAYDDDLRIVFWNAECERVTGYASDIIKETPDPWRLLYPDAEYRESILELLRERGHDFRNWELSVQCSDGRKRLISWSAVPTEEPGPSKWWMVGTDMTERARNEWKLMRATRNWERTFDSVPDPIAIFGLDFRVRQANTAFAEAFSLHPKEIIGKLFQELLGEEGEDIAERVRETARTERGGNRELYIRNMGGHFLVSAGPYFLEEENRPGIIFTARDISHWKQLEEQLRQAQKMEALGTLAGGIAHDFNNILGVIMGYSEMMLESSGEDREARRLEAVLTACSRARDLINQILTFSRQDVQEMRPLHLTPLVKEALKLLRASLPPSVEIRTDLRLEHDVVEADPTQIHQVLINLCTNAAQSMQEAGGVLTVSMEEAVVETESAEAPPFPEADPGSYIRLYVQDTGHGMDQALISRIFDPFFTTKKPGEGTGMGLSVVHGIIKKISGGVAVQSEPGQGTIMSVFIPRSSEAAVSEGDDKTPVPTGAERILLVDDEVELLEISWQMLVSLGYTVTAAADGLEALELFKAGPEQYDLLITDQAMPGMTGVKAAEAMRQASPDLPVIFLTGFSESLSKERVQRLGADVVVKPVLKRRLAEVVRKALDV